MSGKTDQLKGKVEEEAGDLMGDSDLKREGQIDQLAGKTKAVLGDATGWVSDRLKEVSDRLSRPGDNDPEGDEPRVAHRPPAPVTGDAGARAAGSVKDDVT
jgi:uncharacterized protein YjbJ (UPF0337 family)